MVGEKLSQLLAVWMEDTDLSANALSLWANQISNQFHDTQEPLANWFSLVASDYWRDTECFLSLCEKRVSWIDFPLTAMNSVYNSQPFGEYTFSPPDRRLPDGLQLVSRPVWLFAIRVNIQSITKLTVHIKKNDTIKYPWLQYVLNTHLNVRHWEWGPTVVSCWCVKSIFAQTNNTRSSLWINFICLFFFSSN